MTLSALYAHADRMRGNGAPVAVEKREPTPEMLRWQNAGRVECEFCAGAGEHLFTGGVVGPCIVCDGRRTVAA